MISWSLVLSARKKGESRSAQTGGARGQCWLLDRVNGRKPSTGSAMRRGLPAGAAIVPGSARPPRPKPGMQSGQSGCGTTGTPRRSVRTVSTPASEHRTIAPATRAMVPVAQPWAGRDTKTAIRSRPQRVWRNIMEDETSRDSPAGPCDKLKQPRAIPGAAKTFVGDQAAACAFAISFLIFSAFEESSTSFALARNPSSPPRASTVRRAEADTRRRNVRPSASDISAVSFRFGRNRRLVLLLAWLTLLPTIGPFPVSSQRRDIASPFVWLGAPIAPAAWAPAWSGGARKIVCGHYRPRRDPSSPHRLPRSGSKPQGTMVTDPRRDHEGNPADEHHGGHRGRACDESPEDRDRGR